jgi:ribonuclease VapC
MILDSSAVVAIVFQESEYEVLLTKLAAAEVAGIGSPTLVECAIILGARMNQDARSLLARLLHEASVTIIPFTETHYGLALAAWLTYGKGRHPAALNFGDCLSCAVAKHASRPLLCVGNDFPQSDLLLAY